mmetsp:Transcript_43664/g.78906  ORF Transcript_43664/g.78906 Transcript_43664/m.78906 type:complete len:200 (+) Transcript_43664:524-1123(+)
MGAGESWVRVQVETRELGATTRTKTTRRRTTATRTTTTPGSKLLLWSTAGSHRHGGLGAAAAATPGAAEPKHAGLGIREPGDARLTPHGRAGRPGGSHHVGKLQGAAGRQAAPKLPQHHQEGSANARSFPSALSGEFERQLQTALPVAPDGSTKPCCIHVLCGAALGCTWRGETLFQSSAPTRYRATCCACGWTYRPGI